MLIGPVRVASGVDDEPCGNNGAAGVEGEEFVAGVEDALDLKVGQSSSAQFPCHIFCTHALLHLVRTLQTLDQQTPGWQTSGP